MARNKSTYAAIAIVAIGTSSLLAACGGSGNGTTSDLEGSVVVSGSSTVEPITALVAELFYEDNPGVDVRVDGPGTGDGFQLFCSGETDISDASRPIKDEEAALCAGAGIEYVELEVGFDGLAVITAADSELVDCLNFGDLYALVGPESEGFASWDSANDLGVEVGGSGSYPDASLDVTAPGPESGTYDSFIELALKGIAEARVEAGKITEDQAGTVRSDYSSQANDNQIISAVAGSPASLGWVGFAFAEESADEVKTIEIDGGDGCVAASAETVTNGTYPLSRSLYIYVNKASITINPALNAFVDFYMSADGFYSVADSGYVQLPEDQWEATTSAWQAAKG